MKILKIPFSVSVGTVSTQLLPARTGRLGIVFSAPAVNRVNVVFGDTAADGNSGIALYPATQTFSLWVPSDPAVIADAIQAIAQVGAQQISGYEFVVA